MTSIQNSFEVSRRISAKRQEVFDAWTRGESMDWYCPENMRVVSADADVRIGGAYRVTMRADDGQTHTFYGIYEAIVPDRRLVFSHQWEDREPVQTHVTVQFEDDDGGTEVTVTQHGFADPGEAKGHETGWASTLRHLASQLSDPTLVSERPLRAAR
jgi:uncharacterized protein YndB with AHSA1/START domain